MITDLRYVRLEKAYQKLFKGENINVSAYQEMSITSVIKWGDLQSKRLSVSGSSVKRQGGCKETLSRR